MIPSNTSFVGMHSDERMLYVIEPHISRVLRGFVNGLFVAIVACLLCWRVAAFFPLRAAAIMDSSGWVAGVVFMLCAWLNIMSYRHARTYITDRRILRHEWKFPGYIAKRGLFWSEVGKVKSMAPIFMRLFRVGTLTVQPTILSLEDVEIFDVFYFEDLAHYIDKVVFTYRNNPAQIQNIRPFVPKPKWQRYPVEQSATGVKVTPAESPIKRRPKVKRPIEERVKSSE